MNSNDKKVTFIGFGVLFLMLALSMAFGSNASGDDDGSEDRYDDPFEGYTLYSEQLSISGDLQEGAEESHEIDVSGKVVKNISAVLKWEDESDVPGRPRIRRYENAPDSFSLSLRDDGGNFSEEDSGTNPQGEEGKVNVAISINNTLLGNMMDPETGWYVDISMTEAGNWAPMIGFIGFEDNGNSYSLVVKYEYYDPTEMSEE